MGQYPAAAVCEWVQLGEIKTNHRELSPKNHRRKDSVWTKILAVCSIVEYLEQIQKEIERDLGFYFSLGHREKPPVLGGAQKKNNPVALFPLLRIL